MTLGYLKSAVDDGNEIFFTHNNKRCAILVEVKDGAITFVAVYGETESRFGQFDMLAKAAIFGGKSFVDLLDVVEFDFY